MVAGIVIQMMCPFILFFFFFFVFSILIPPYRKTCYDSAGVLLLSGSGRFGE